MSIVGKKRSLLKRLKKEALRLKFLWKSSSFKWNRLTLPVSFMEDVVFKVVSAFEAVVLVLTLCFFYLCCGCSFWFIYNLYHFSNFLLFNAITGFVISIMFISFKTDLVILSLYIFKGAKLKKIGWSWKVLNQRG